MNTNDVLGKLHSVTVEAVEYVGSANYREREIAALKALSNAFRAAARGAYEEIVFKIEEEEYEDEE